MLLDAWVYLTKSDAGIFARGSRCRAWPVHRRALYLP